MRRIVNVVMDDENIGKVGNKIAKSSLITIHEIEKFYYLCFGNKPMLATMNQIAYLKASELKGRIFTLGKDVMDAIIGNDPIPEMAHWYELHSWNRSLNPYRSFIMFKLSQMDIAISLDVKDVIDDAVILENCFDDVVNVIWLAYIDGSKLVHKDNQWFIQNNTVSNKIAINEEFFFKNLLHLVGVKDKDDVVYPIDKNLFIALSSISTPVQWDVRI